MYPDEKRKRESKKNNIIKSFFGVATFGLIYRYFDFVFKLINDLSWGNNASKYCSTKNCIFKTASTANI